MPWSAIGKPAAQSVTRSESPASTCAQAYVRVGDWRDQEPTSVHSGSRRVGWFAISRPRPRHEGVALGSTALRVGFTPGVRENGRKAAGRSDAVRLLVSGILRGVWALRGDPAPGFARAPVRRCSRVARRRPSWFTREEWNGSGPFRSDGNAVNPSWQQVAIHLRVVCGGSRRGGAKPRGRNGTDRMAPIGRGAAFALPWSGRTR